jgi:nitrogen fixation/metabolism regulation signal transduction histidine kinase
MTIRRKFILYIVLLHAAAIAAFVFALWNDRIWLLAVEAGLAISVIVAFRLFRKLFRPLELLLAGAATIKESDFTTRLRFSGQEEMDALVEVYNGMIDHLRDERVALQERQFFLEKIIHASPLGVITLDYDGKVALVNPAAAELLQHSSGELMGKTAAEIPSPLAQVFGTLAVGESLVVPLRGIRKVKCVKSEFLDRGFPRTFLLLEELTEELRQTEKAAYEKLIRMMSHEVNNSLGAASSLLHSSLKYKDQIQPEDRDDFANALGIAISRADHLNAFMKRFADIVKLAPPLRRDVDVENMLDHIALFMRPECAKREIELAREFHGTSGIRVSMDREQMEQAFINIVKNAIEAVGTNGKVTLRLERVKGRLLACVEDTGPGIEPAARQMLFTPFYSTKENGQGIGLTLVQEILSQHNFEFTLDSAEGVPTRFTVYLT